MAQQADFIASNGIYRPCPLCGNDNTEIKPSIYSRRSVDHKNVRPMPAWSILENPPAYEDLGETTPGKKTSHQVIEEKKKKGLCLAARRASHRELQGQV